MRMISVGFSLAVLFVYANLTSSTERDTCEDKSESSQNESCEECPELSEENSNVLDTSVRQSEPNQDESRSNEQSEENSADESESDESEAESDNPIIDKVIDKADSVTVFLDKVFEKADDKVTQWIKLIRQFRSRLPGIAYGGSLMTVYYTFTPILRNTQDILKKIARSGYNGMRWFTSKSNVGAKNNPTTRGHRFPKIRGRPFRRYEYGSKRRRFNPGRRTKYQNRNKRS